MPEISYDEVTEAYASGRAIYAIELGFRYLAAHPEPRSRHAKLATCLYLVARYPEARRVYTRLLRSPHDGLRRDVYRDLGDLYAYKLDYGRAIQWYQRLTAEFPDAAEGYAHLGRVLAMSGQLAEAEAALRKALACQRDHVFTLCQLGCVLRAQERYREARTYLLRALRHSPRYDTARQALRDLNRLAAHRTRSRTAKQAAKPRCSAKQALRACFVAWDNEANPAYALQRSREYLAREPRNVGVLAQVGSILVKLQRFAEAQRIFKDLLRRARPLVGWQPLCLLGHACRGQGRTRSALNWYRQAAEAAPHHANPRIFLGALLARCGRLAEAEAVHRRGTQCTEGCIDEAYFNLALVVRSQKRYAEAIGYLHRAIEIDPDDDLAKAELWDLESTLEYLDGRRGPG